MLLGPLATLPASGVAWQTLFFFISDRLDSLYVYFIFKKDLIMWEITYDKKKKKNLPSNMEEESDFL